jgi:hypothetical protein
MMAVATNRVSSMLEAALWWAAQGMPVFPVFEMVEGKCACGPTDACVQAETAGKHPRIARNLILATVEEKQIREWWARWPNANIGIATGNDLPGGGYLLVVDVDPRHDGDMNLALLEQKHGTLPETARNVTGGGGQHIFLRSGGRVKSRSNSLGPGVDVKCMGGYVLAPPSIHASGRRYMRDAGADISDTPIADAPSWLVVLADPPEVKPRAEVGAADAFIEGGRHDAMVSLAGVMRRRGLSGAEMLPTMKAVNETRCKPPLDEHELKKIAYSAKWDPQEPIKGQDPWNLMSTEQIFAELPPYPWLVQGLHLAPGRITLLNGYADVGKTVIAMTVALAVASGTPVWGVFKPARAGRVLHLNGELGSYIARERYQRLARGSAIDGAALVASGNLVLSNYPETRLDDKDFEEKLAQVCEGFALVVIDSLRAFSGALDENAKEIGVALFKLARVSNRTGATIVVLHHNRKPSKDDIGGAKMAISGSSSILGGAECAFVMTSTEKGGPILVQHERSPIGRPLADFGLQIEDIAFDGNPRWGLRVVHMEGEQMEQAAESAQKAKEQATIERASSAIVEVLRRSAGVFRGSSEAFRATCAVRRNDFVAALADLVNRGVVNQEGTYHKPEWHLAG